MAKKIVRLGHRTLVDVDAVQSVVLTYDAGYPYDYAGPTCNGYSPCVHVATAQYVAKIWPAETTSPITGCKSYETDDELWQRVLRVVGWEQ